MPESRSREVRTPRWVYALVVLTLAVWVPGGIAIAWVLRHPFASFEEAVVRYAAANMTQERRREFYSVLTRNFPANIWEAVPEPLVGRVLQFDIRKTDKQVEVVTNFAGMRSSRAYGPKPADRFRIACLGDSMVMGTAGREEDRWCDQLEQMLRERGVLVDGRPVETVALGVGGWSALNAASFLGHRVSSYAPDLVLAMMVANDLSDNPGVLGVGQVTFAFTPERRADGSGVIADHWPLNFGFGESNLLVAGMGSESRFRWQRAFGAWRRLEGLLDQSGGRLLLGVLSAASPFPELCRRYHAESGMQSPLFVTDYFGKRLRHDPHPDREGHAILAAHYLHVLARLGWLPVREADLPALHEGLSTEVPAPPEPDQLAALQRELAERVLPEEIAFDRLGASEARALLGGIYPASESERLTTPPFGTLRSGFLLRRRADAQRVRLEIDVPPHPELFPFRLEMQVDGQVGGSLALATASQAGRHVLYGAVAAPSRAEPTVEVLLRTDSYWTEIEDFTMKSYRLISARQEGGPG